jgi:alkylation response protein AidB-like acyl-CoA dehydrogenase
VDFSLTEEQILLKDSVSRFVADHFTVEQHRKLNADGLAFDTALWQQFAELGFLAVPFTEEQGGIEGGPVDIMVMAEALGAGVSRLPYLSTVISCGALLRAVETDKQLSYIEGIIDGSAQWAFAFADQHSGYALDRVTATAQRSGDGFVLNGEKLAVLNGDCADYLIVSANLAGEGLSLFVVERTQDGVAGNPFLAIDGSGGAHLQFNNVQLSGDTLLGEAGAALPLIEQAVDQSILAMGAEAVGAMQVLLDATVEYSKTREQFGQPIGKFQALQHRMADMYLKLEELRSLVLNAAIALGEESAQSRQACAALKVKISEAGKYVSQQAVQIHGGIGMTDELVVGHHFKRLMMLAQLYGDEGYYLQRYVELSAA